METNPKNEEKCKKHGVVHKNGGYPSCPQNEEKKEYEYIPKKVNNVCCKVCGITSEVRHTHPVLSHPEKELHEEFSESISRISKLLKIVKDKEINSFLLSLLEEIENRKREKVDCKDLEPIMCALEIKEKDGFNSGLSTSADIIRHRLKQ